MMSKQSIAIASIFAALGLTGCRHQALVPSTPSPPMLSISVPPPTHHSELLPIEELEEVPSLSLKLPYVPLPRLRLRRATAKQLAILIPLAPPLDLGELSTGGESDSDKFRQQTQFLLGVQQQRLRNLPQASTLLHHQQVQQASLFLRQALEAWRNHDVQAANVLATKTKLLLDEF